MNNVTTRGAVNKMSKKESTQRALESYYQNLLPKTSTKKRASKNQRPEKETEKQCMAWMKGMGWEVAIYEAKAIFNPHADRYISQNMKAGTCDCMGTMPCGTSVAVEFKAKGALSSYNILRNKRQRDFIEKKIQYHAFACVVDSLERLTSIYNEWSKLTLESKELARNYLLEMLPRRNNKKGKAQDHGILW
jgi:hypothetical protein